MASEQTTLGDEGVAEELAREQRAISIAEFFEKNKQMLGFDSGARALVTAVKEGVDNSLDATEEAGHLPDIYVEITEEGDYYRLVVEDNGPGITREQIPKVFGKLLYGSRFGVRVQARGQQGIGISAAVLYSQLTSGKPAKVTSKTATKDRARYFELTIDTDANEPEIEHEETTTWDRTHGTRIELEMEANMRARSQLHDYIKHTAVVNPHARLEFREPDAHLKSERATDQLPAETEEIRPHPHGIELGTLMKMLDATDSYSVSGFLQGEFTRVGGKTADAITDRFRDRHFGREMTWTAPDDAELSAAVRGAVNGKGREATAAFGRHVADAVAEAGRVSYAGLERAAQEAAEAVARETEYTFGTTVRENAVAAAWELLVEDRAGDLRALVDEATTSRKDDEAVAGLADRLAASFESADSDRDRLTRSGLADRVADAAERTKEYDDESFGGTAREKITDAVWAVCEGVPDDLPKVGAVADDRDVASALLNAMRETDILAPPTDCLSPITAELLEEGLRKEYDADFYATTTRDAEVHAGDPFVVEAGVAYGGDLVEDGGVDTMRFANRVPLVYRRGACATTSVVKRINWRNYGLDQPGGSGIPNGPAVLAVHVASTNVPFTNESKDAIAGVEEIEDEIELALREVGRELKSYLNKRRSIEQRRRKENVIAEILPEMAAKLSEVTGREPLAIEDSLARIMNNVLVERSRENGQVRLTVTNHSDATADLELTDIVDRNPGDVEGATVVEMDGEWFVKWSPAVPSGGEAALEYDLDGEATFDISVDGIESAKLTIDAQ